MGIRGRPRAETPGFEVGDTRAHMQGLGRKAQQIANRVSGPVSLALGQGGRKRYRRQLNKWLQPLKGILPLGAALGLPTSYEPGEQAIRRAMTLGRRGAEVGKDQYNTLVSTLRNQFANQWGTPNDASAGYGFNQIGAATQQLARMGRLGELNQKYLTEYDSKRVADKVKGYLQAAGAMAEDMGGPIQQHIARLANMGIDDPDELLTMVRMQQLISRAQKGTVA